MSKDYNILEELSKSDDRWRSVALKICGNKQIADDLVQDMYLKVATYDKVNANFVYKVITNLFLDSFKKYNPESIEPFHYLKCNDEAFEADDEQQEILDKFDNLYWIDQDLIRESYDRSMRDIQDAYPMIHYTYAHRRITLSIKEILGTDFDTVYFNNNNKHKRDGKKETR
jgi:DNA-directed RNA polymerase specialized sigma24 family protein|tara:strand:+ start:203 stop:715 length:513 start_codon:yes stop_codon:yes gene_type:complete